MPDWMHDFTHTSTAAALFAMLSWWFGTGAILWLVRRPQRTLRPRMLAMTAILVASIAGAWYSMRTQGTMQAYLGFACVIAMWGWHELAFLSGWLIGPRREPLSPGLGTYSRFVQSLQAILHHELGLLLNFGLLIWLQVGQPNHVAVCTFALLWIMRLSAKLNLFIGVPQLGEQYLPGHLEYLGSYFQRSKVGWFFWASITLATAAWLWLVGQAVTGAVALSTGWVLLATLLALAIVEHLLMMFPLQLQHLWGWAMGVRGREAGVRS